MIRRSLLAAAIVAVALARPAAGPNESWPQFRGASAGVAENDPALARQLERDEQYRLDRRRPGHGLELARGVGRPRVRHLGRSTAARPKRRSPGSTWAENGRRLRRRIAGWCTTSTSRPASCAGRRKCAGGVPPQPRHLKNSYASETPVTDGERVYFYFGSVGLFVFDMKGDTRLVEAARPVQDAQRVGHGGVARSPPRSRLHRQRQRRAVVPGRVRQADRRRSVAREPRRGHATGRRRSSGSTTAAPRSSPRAPARCGRTT